MHIEEIDATSAHKATDRELKNLRFRCIQLFAAFAEGAEQVGGLSKEEFIQKYVTLRLEMKRRGLSIATQAELDNLVASKYLKNAYQDKKLIDPVWADKSYTRARIRMRDIDEELKMALCKSAVYSLDVPSLGEVVLVESYVSIAGSFVKSPLDANDMDVVIRDPDELRDEGMELKLSRLLAKLTEKDPHFIYAPKGPHSTYIPIFDLVLRARPATKKVNVMERDLSKKLSPAQQRDLEAENEKIRSNKETPEAKKPHKFRPAEWTHGNGHPRCLLCGSEEPIYDECCGLAMEDDQTAYQAFYDRLTAERGDDGRLGKAVGIRPGSKFTPLKTKGGYGELEFSSVEPSWTEFAQGYIPDPGVAVETKYDGFRSTLHKQGDRIWIMTEDAHRDLGSMVPDLVKEIKALPIDSLVLDSELMIFVDGKKIERKNMGQYLCQNPIAEFKPLCAVFDCLYYDGQALDKLSWTERQEYIDKVFKGKGAESFFLKRVEPTIVHSEKDYKSAVKRHAGEAHSEGAMLKVVTADYPLSGSTPLWAKVKNFKEIRCRVISREAADGKGHRYDCEIEDGIHIGKTYSSEIEAQVGDVIEVMVAEVKYEKDEDKFTWDNPIPRSLKPKGTALTTREQALALSRLGRTQNVLKERAVGEGGEFGNISFKQGDEGDGIAQIHMMGLTEEEIGKLKDNESRILVARADLTKLDPLLKGLLGDQGAHVDIRLHEKGTQVFEGAELFVGELGKLDKLSGFKHGSKPLRMAWKQSRVGEPKTPIIQGPLGWMHAGEKKIEVFPPGEVGATSQKFGMMLMFDKYTWQLYYAKTDRHSYRFHFEGGRYFKGNWAFVWVPGIGEGGTRVWLTSILPDDDHTKPTPEERLKAFLRFMKTDKKKQVVGGVVYEPDALDTQGDWTDAEEIEKAMYLFMEKYADQTKRIKVMHRGKVYHFPILECFQPEEDTKKGDQIIKAGSWWVLIKVKEPEIWDEIEKGKLTGFSMGGSAKSD